MDQYRIEADDDGVEVSKIQPDGKAFFVGRFSSEDNARLWIDARAKPREGPFRGRKDDWR